MRFSVAHLVVSRLPSGGDDRVAVFHREADVVIALADGAGGTGSGSRAADTAILEVRRHIEVASDVLPQAVVQRADAAVCARADGGLTTLVVVLLSANGLMGASVGDSEAWIVSEDSVVRLTERQQRKPLLGSGDAGVVPFGAASLEGTLLVASDGLFKYSSVAKILEVVRSTSVDLLPERLADLVRLRSGSLQDDVAIAAAEVVPVAAPGASLGL